MSDEAERLRLLAEARRRQALARQAQARPSAQPAPLQGPGGGPANAQRMPLEQAPTAPQGGYGSWAQQTADAPGFGVGFADRQRGIDPATGFPYGVDAPLQSDIRDQRMEAITDNVVGLDNGVMSPGETLARALNAGGESMTLGVVGDEASAAVAALGPRTYDEALQAQRQREAEFRDQHPGMALTADVGGAFAVPFGAAANWAMRGTTGLARAWRGAAAGTAAGATLGFMEGEGDVENRLENAAVGGAVGGFFGGTIPGAASALGAGFRRLWNRSEQRPTIEALQDVKNQAYQAVEDAGETFTGDDMVALRDRVAASFADDPNYVPGEDTAVDAALRIFERRSGEDTTIGQLDRIRQGLFNRVRTNPSQVQIYDAISAIDDLIASRADTSALMQVAREANGRFAQSQLLNNAFQRARDQAESTGSGGNVANLYRQAVTRIINNPRQARFFRPEQIETMRAFLSDTTGQRFARIVGKMSPSGNGLMMTLHTISGVASGGLTLPLMAAGEAGARSAQRSVMRGADELLDMTSGFTSPSGAVAPIEARPALLFGQGGARLGEDTRRQNALDLAR